MAERNASAGLLLVRAQPLADITAEVTALMGWTEFHAQTITQNPTRETSRLTGGGALPNRGKVLAAGAAGTFGVTIARLDGGTVDPAAFFDGIQASESARFSYVFQPNRAALLAAGVVVPAASDANPQYVSSVVMTSLDEWGAGGDTPMILNVTGELDSDYAVYR